VPPAGLNEISVEPPAASKPSRGVYLSRACADTATQRRNGAPFSHTPNQRWCPALRPPAPAHRPRQRTPPPQRGSGPPPRVEGPAGGQEVHCLGRRRPPSVAGTRLAGMALPAATGVTAAGVTAAPTSARPRPPPQLLAPDPMGRLGWPFLRSGVGGEGGDGVGWWAADDARCRAAVAVAAGVVAVVADVAAPAPALPAPCWGTFTPGPSVLFVASSPRESCARTSPCVSTLGFLLVYRVSFVFLCLSVCAQPLCSGSCPHSQRGITPSENPAQDAERYARATTRTPGSLGAKRLKKTEVTQTQR